MNKFAKIAMYSLAVVIMMAAPAFAQGGAAVTEDGAAVTEDGAAVAEAADSGLVAGLAAGLGAVGAGLVCIGSAGGIGKLAASAFECRSRDSRAEVGTHVQK